MENFHLPPEDLNELRRIARRVKGSAHEWKRARYLILLHEGEDPETVCRCLDIRCNLGDQWRKKYEHDGLSSLKLNDYSAREGHLKLAQEIALRELLRKNPMRTTDEIRAHISKTYKQEYSRSGCIKLMHRLGFSYKKPKKLASQADEQEQHDFITKYNKLQNYLPEDEVIYFGDAVHPDHQVRPAHGWFHKDECEACHLGTTWLSRQIRGASVSIFMARFAWKISICRSWKSKQLIATARLRYLSD